MSQTRAEVSLDQTSAKVVVCHMDAKRSGEGVVVDRKGPTMIPRRRTLSTVSKLLAAALAVMTWPQTHSGQVVEYYHLDGLGSVRAMTNQNGDIVERHDYLPWGDEHAPGLMCPGGPGTCQAVEFTGKERDAETGQDYFGARYYRATTARFAAVDPVYSWNANLTDPQRWNRYAYVRNNPLRYVDPDGRDLGTLDEMQRLSDQRERGEITFDEYLERATAIGRSGLIAPPVVGVLGVAAAAPEVGVGLATEAAIAVRTCLLSNTCHEVFSEAAAALSGVPGSVLRPSGQLGIARELQVAKQLGGRVWWQKIVARGIGATEVDVLGPKCWLP